ncbi:MAG TPA: tetratricopeptide repeat protein [Acetobacteraceae bacterium]|nr:tetratricopeptide repeat protein [Acetobacteraceae bacterium]
MTGWAYPLQEALDSIEAGEPARAEAICRSALEADRSNQALLLLCGLAVGAQGDLERAWPLLRGVAHAREHGSDPRHEMAGLTVRQRCRQLLVALYRTCLRQLPDDDQLRYCVAEFLHEAHEFDEAAQILGEGLRRHPRWPAAHQLLGIIHADRGQYGAAIGQFRLVTQLVPEQAGGWANLGAMLKVEGRFDAALKAYDKAVALAPQDARIRVNRTVALLHAGRLLEAWRDFEWRLALPEHQDASAHWLMPQLAELGQVAGHTILVTHSDGFGDTLQFMRYVPLLAEHGARVIAWVPKLLERVMRSLDGVADILTGDRPVPHCDFHSPFVSLPRVFATTLETIPRAVPYLPVARDLVERWGRWLPDDGLRVGLVWSGQSRPHVPGFDVLDARRSTTLATFAPLARVPFAHFINLQMGPAADQARDSPPGLALIDPMAEVSDFADTAGIVANLDVVVSVDTSVVHLAGAVGKPVLMLDRYDNCWRWLSGRTDSPWYPKLRIFRQKRPGEWGPVVARVANALTVMAERRAAA